LMYRQAQISSQGSVDYFETDRNEQLSENKRRTEHAISIGVGGSIIRTLFWHAKSTEPTYLRDIFREQNFESSGDVVSRVGWIVWVRIDYVANDISNWELSLTIYGPPKKGFTDILKRANVFEHLKLGTHVFVQGQLHKYPDILIMTGMLREMCQWYWNDSSVREDWKGNYLTDISGEENRYVCLGDKESGGVSFEVDGDRVMKIVSVSGTLPQIRNMLRNAIKLTQ